MNKEIWKFVLKVDDWQTIMMPIGAEILTVQMLNSEPCLWALIDPNTEKESRNIEMFGTGHSVNYDNYGMGVSRKYISTFQVYSGVFHVFENTGKLK